MADADQTKTLEAKCFCGSVHLTVDVPASCLPLGVYLCHCSICRYTTGSPCVFHAQLPEDLRPTFVDGSSEGSLTSYVVREGGYSHRFCSTCGCHVGGVSPSRRHWVVSTSIFTDHGPDNFRIQRHVFGKSAKGGGLASVVTRIGGRDMGSLDPPDDDARARLVESAPEVGDDGADRLRAQCLCGGVSFTIRRPTQRVLDDGYMSRYVSPLDDTRWKASLDTCSDCRRLCGTHVVGWAFVPLSACEPAMDATLRIGTAKTYASSEGVLRSFCGTCGATVMYSCAGRRPTPEQAVVDVAMGILRAPEGVMAEDWLTWRTGVVFAGGGKAFDGEFGDALGEGMRAWTRAKYGAEVDFDVV